MKNNVNLSKKYKKKEEVKVDKIIASSILLDLITTTLDLLSCFL